VALRFDLLLRSQLHQTYIFDVSTFAEFKTMSVQLFYLRAAGYVIG